MRLGVSIVIVPAPIDTTVTPIPITLSTADTAAPTDIPVVLIPVINVVDTLFQ